VFMPGALRAFGCRLAQVQKPNDPVKREHCPDQKGESIGSHLGTPTATHPI
jgi:hypothetical protein